MVRRVLFVAAALASACDPTAENRPAPVSAAAAPTPLTAKLTAKKTEKPEPPDAEAEFKPDDAKIEAYIASHKKLSKQTTEDLRAHVIRIGMTSEEVLLIYGPPDDTHTLETKHGVSETWIYQTGEVTAEYLHFEDGVLTAWQD